MENKATMFTSDRQDWGTPRSLFDKLNDIFAFNLDVCAHDENTKCHWYLSEEQDGLSVDWFEDCAISMVSPSCWMNPPYSRPVHPCKTNCKKKACVKRGHHIKEYIPGLDDWMNKLYLEVDAGCQVVALVPARIDTQWFQTMWLAEALIFVHGRITFDGASHGAPFPSVIGIFGRAITKKESEKLSEIGKVVIP